MTSSLVGSEMCIRDRPSLESARRRRSFARPMLELCSRGESPGWPRGWGGCLLYTSDAADDM
eukprot:2805121-Prorocentrum_lima.AAC.1